MDLKGLQEFVRAKGAYTPLNDNVVLGTGATGKVYLKIEGIRDDATGKEVVIFLIKPSEDFKTLEKLDEKEMIRTSQGWVLPVKVNKDYCRLLNQVHGARRWIILSDSKNGETELLRMFHGTIDELEERDTRIRQMSIKIDRLEAEKDILAETGTKEINEGIKDLNRKFDILVGAIGGPEATRRLMAEKPR